MTKNETLKPEEINRNAREFLDRCTHFYYQRTGDYAWPNNCEGDLLKMIHPVAEAWHEKSRKPDLVPNKQDDLKCPKCDGAEITPDDLTAEEINNVIEKHAESFGWVKGVSPKNELEDGYLKSMEIIQRNINVLKEAIIRSDPLKDKGRIDLLSTGALNLVNCLNDIEYWYKRSNSFSAPSDSVGKLRDVLEKLLSKRHAKDFIQGKDCYIHVNYDDLRNAEQALADCPKEKR